MATILLAFVVMALVMTGMAIGVIVANKPIKGSCGGIASLGFGRKCEVCGGDRTLCDSTQDASTEAGRERKDTRAADGFYEVK